MQLLRALGLFLGLFALTATTLASPARALTLLRDPDIEYALKQLAAPVLKAAGLSPTGVDILLIDDRNLNAFVVDRDSIFIHSGLMLKMNNAAMLQSVIAHEAAHITNGHLVRRPVNMRNARTAAGLGSVLAAAAAIAAGAGEAAGAVALGAQTTAQRLFFVHTRAEENAADQSGLRYLAAAGVDPQGAVEMMDIFRGQEALSQYRQDPYARTHPLSADRFRVIKRLADAHADKARANPESDYWFARAKGKLSAFQRSPKWTLTRAGESGYEDVKLMRQAVAHHRSSQTSKAVAAIDRAIALRPKDPFLYELKGQILMESRNFRAATAAYGRAVNLAPDHALILGSYGRALMAEGKVAEAQQYLEKSRARDGRDARVMRDLAATHARQGNNGMASLVTSERYAMMGRLEDAGIHAQRASDLLPRGSTGWRRAQDVLSAAKAAENKRR
ncbi:putative Zn-dependent protease [Roseovarius halotolerans]|uniref:TPR repeat-containing protein YfgC n=1 Tax=Roseovarius halotolerans TaxID=505353 RepID=A0A1X6YLA8_9RHOB|nr:M48 family metalloprotease [Roseovarius halotolerans]RKT34365.1 putative Zn-dependent protease [Roseovarius halotolerans]SLN24406.1 TPR repeat-containing protein YfgC precursor [Roseovarius halotolerans]